MEPLKHECGVAMIRLLKPLQYYQQKYGTWMYGLNKLYLLMEKQHNRGQEAAGMSCVKLTTTPGHEYMFRERAEGSNAITEIFSTVQKGFAKETAEHLADARYAERSLPFAGELYMGHLRYSTTGKSGLSYVHPFLRRNNWRAKNLSLCGNFNMTNIGEIFERLTRQGQCPRIYSDSYIMLELMGHRLDREVERNFVAAQALGLTDTDITQYIEDNVNVANVLRTTMPHFDGGYVVCGVTGSGEMFSMRDPWGIRPAFYYKNDEVAVVASERPVLQTTFAIECDDVKELEPGTALIVKRNGDCRIERIMEQKADSSCSFERIYFSRGSDASIYKERKKLGEQLTNPILRAIDYDTKNTVLSYSPNTTAEELEEILSNTVRLDKVAWKDIKLRTFIAEGNSRNDLASHVYDVTYESIRAGKDNLVIIDDSIVRGTTLQKSILRILDRLHPKKIIVVSSAPQIRYPDYYGIDMPRLEEFCVFRAAIELLKEKNMHALIKQTYDNCRRELKKPVEEMDNCVRQIYKAVTVDEINRKIVQMLRPKGVKTPIELVFQSIEGLHEAIPQHKGDWYFTGNYPTPGGMRLCNQAFVNYIEKVYQNEQKF